MKILFLDGSKKTDSFAEIVNKNLTNSLEEKGFLVENIRLYEHEIKGCIGCFSCFFKTPGQCIFNDIAREIPRTYVNSDIVVLLTPLTFGGYSSTLARAYNRIVIQIESHLFKKSEGEITRKKRYKQKYPLLLAVCTYKNKNDNQKNTFEYLVKRNSYITHAPGYTTLFLSEKLENNEILKMIDNAISKLNKLL